MSTATLTREVTPQQVRRTGRVTMARVVNSEWIKFRTLRSSWFTLLAGVAALIAIGLILGYNTGKNFATLRPEDAAPSGVLQGYFLAQLLIAVLGVLFVSGEYSTGMIRSSLAAVPRRIPVLLAKALVFGAVALVTMVAASLTTFAGAQLFLSSYGHGTSLTDPGVLRVVLGTGVYLALIGLLGGAIGWIVRSTPGGIASVVGLLLVVPGIIRVLPGSLSETIGTYLPGNAGGSFITSVHVAGSLAPWTGLGVLVLWVVGLLAVAAALLRHRDA